MSDQNQVPMHHVLAAQQAQGQALAPNQATAPIAPVAASDQAPGALTPIYLPDILDPLESISETPSFPMLPSPQNPVPIARACIDSFSEDLPEFWNITLARYTEDLRHAVLTGNYREVMVETLQNGNTAADHARAEKEVEEIIQSWLPAAEQKRNHQALKTEHETLQENNESFQTLVKEFLAKFEAMEKEYPSVMKSGSK